MTTGNMIKAMRKYMHMTQKELGMKCGINEANIRKYELDLAIPKHDTIVRIANALGVPYYFILNDDGIGQAFLNGEFTIEDYRSALSGKERTPSATIRVFNIGNDPGIIERTILDDIKALEDEEKSMVAQITGAFAKLNPTGKGEAVKRVQELTQIPRYIYQEKE